MAPVLWPHHGPGFVVPWLQDGRVEDLQEQLKTSGRHELEEENTCCKERRRRLERCGRTNRREVRGEIGEGEEEGAERGRVG